MFNKTIPLTICLIILSTCINSVYAQSLNWVFLQNADENSTACISNSSIADSVACFGLAYMPGETGVVSSYTFGYFVECADGVDAIISANSCVMDDVTNIFADCASSGFSLFQASGQNGNLAVTAGDSIIVHQVCITLGANDTLDVLIDDITGASVSMDIPDGSGGTMPYTDLPSVPPSIMLTDTIFGLESCEDSKVCSMNFGSTETRISFDLNGNDNILDAASDTSLTSTLSLDIYDEVNMICQVPGGQDDIELTISLLTTQDQYGHFYLDTLAGEEHRIIQESNGLLIELPFGTSLNSESSSSDTRGFSFKVEFENHLGVQADQLTVDLADVNSTGEIFESAAVIFLNEYKVPYDTIIYNGFFQDSSDLSGNCNINALGTAWASTGNGIGSFFLDSLNRIDLSNACNPVPGTSTNDTVSVRAVEDAGLDPSNYIGGFIVYVIGEDVASPLILDDGSGMNGDDGVISNENTTTNGILQSKVLGFTIDGCIFQPPTLPVDFMYFRVDEVNGKAELEWKTANIVNHSHYEIEWSRNARSFITIGENFDGFAKDGTYLHQFAHNTPSKGINYYRLKQVDLNGEFSYTDIKNIFIGQNELVNSNIYPNPTNNAINVEFQHPLIDGLVLQLFSIQGEILVEKVIVENTKSYSLDLLDFQKGTYFLRIGNEMHKIIKY